MRRHSQTVGVNEHTKEVCKGCNQEFIPIDKWNFHCQVCQPCKPL